MRQHVLLRGDFMQLVQKVTGPICLSGGQAAEKLMSSWFFFVFVMFA